MMKEYVYTSIRVLLFITLLINISCSNRTQKTADYTRISSLARSFSYEQILTEFSNYPWYREQDPAMFMIYCKALVESGRGIPSFLQSPPLPIYIGKFVQGYHDLLSGNLRKALTEFVKITETQEGRIWGYIGLLEYALYTESIANMKDPLELLQIAAARHPSSVPSWVMPFYSAWYYFYSGKFSDTERVIRSHRKQLDPITLTDLMIQLLIRENRFKDAEESIKNLHPQFLNDQDVIDLEAYIIRLKHGPEQAAKYLYEKHRNFPYMWLIEQRYAEVLIESGQTELGFNILKKLAQKRPFDIMIQVGLVEKLFYYGNGKEVKDILAKLYNSDVTQLPRFNVLLAYIYHTQGKEEKAQKYLNRAKELYPNDPHLLWLMFHIAMKKHDYDNAHRVVKEILELDPNEVSALISLMEVSYLRKDWNELSVAEKAINQSNRYISEKEWDEVKSFKALALAANGKFDESEDIARKIKNSNMRVKTISEIDKLKTNKRH